MFLSHCFWLLLCFRFALFFVVCGGMPRRASLWLDVQVQLTKSLACEWGKLGVRVNCVAPWMTQTPMLAEATKNDPTALDQVGWVW